MLVLSPVLNDLETCVDDSFSPEFIESFLRGLATRGISLDDFDAVIISGLLSEPGETYAGDQEFETTAELYQNLEEPDRAQMKRYYQKAVQRLRDERSDLIRKYF